MIASSANPAILFDGVSKWFGAMPVLHDLSFTVRDGEKVVIVGPSGSGKSTAIRCINGLETYQQGRITVHGAAVTENARDLLRIRRAVGMVFQSFNLFPHLTVLENCTLAPMRVLGQSRRDANEIANTLLQRVRIGEQAGKYPAQLSGGQQQRVAIARALCMRPKIMLFDEPTSALDPEMVHEVLDCMLELAASGMTMVCVTHEMAFARQMADTMLFLEGGRLIEAGPPADLMASGRGGRLRGFMGATGDA